MANPLHRPYPSVQFPAMRHILPRSRLLHFSMLIGCILIAVTGGIAWHDTMRPPVIRTLDIALPGLPKNSPPLRLILISDIHVAGPDMPPSRVRRIADQINALKPDIIILAGDVTSDKRTATRIYSTPESVAPLATLKARLGKIAVAGNHDHWRGIACVHASLLDAGFVVLTNEARKIGPIVIGGLDDDFTGHADLPATLHAMDALPGPKVLISHSPDPFADLRPGRLLMLAGHTHCGQIGYPWGGSPATMSRYGDRYACGVIHENGNTLVVSAGLGTSVLPLRFLVPPDAWAVHATSTAE